MTKFQTPFNENIQKQSTNNWGLPQPKSFDLILQKNGQLMCTIYWCKFKSRQQCSSYFVRNLYLMELLQKPIIL